jgi:8-oxo-dGTP pyrophosphatase MutT (NUDIX family)
VRREISAGCVIYRVERDSVQVALIRPKGRNSWALPKGMVEQGEASEAAARREAEEETGLQGEIAGKIDNIKYTYTTKWENPQAKIFKIVTFYLMRHTGGDTSLHDWEVDDVRWFPIDQAIANVSYSTEKQVLRKAKGMLGATLL